MIHPLRQLWDTPLYDHSRLPLPMETITSTLPHIMNLKSAVSQKLEQARAEKRLGSSLQSSVLIKVHKSDLEDARANEIHNIFHRIYGKDILRDILVVSDVEIKMARSDKVHEQVEIEIREPGGHKCPRCWRYLADQEDELCGRCDNLVGDAEVPLSAMT